MHPAYQNTSRLSPYFYQPVNLTPEGHIVQAQSYPYPAQPQFPLEQNTFAKEAKKSADFWSKVMRITSFIVLISLSAYVFFDIMDDGYDHLDPIVAPFALLRIVGILLCLKAIDTSKSSDAVQAKRYLKLLCIYIASWLLVELVLLFLVGLALFNQDPISERDGIEHDLFGAFSILWIVFCATMALSSPFVLIAVRAYKTRMFLMEAATKPNQHYVITPAISMPVPQFQPGMPGMSCHQSQHGTQSPQVQSSMPAMASHYVQQGVPVRSA